jgi:hypothetical protein
LLMSPWGGILHRADPLVVMFFPRGAVAQATATPFLIDPPA